MLCHRRFHLPGSITHPCKHSLPASSLGGSEATHSIMDLRSEHTIDRKRSEAIAERQLAARKRQEAETTRNEARRKQREEENMDRRAEKAQRHSEQLRRDREQTVARIEGYHRHIDSCIEEMKDCERRIDEFRSRIRNQQETIRVRRQEAISLRLDADLFRKEADKACMQGAMERETQGTSERSKHRELLQKAEEKQREAMRKDRESEEHDRSATEGERNVHRLCDSLLANGRMRSEVEREKEREEKRVAEMGEKLKTYKIEVANCEYLSRRLRDEEARLESVYNTLDEEADEAERIAVLAEHEAYKLESEIRHIT